MAVTSITTLAGLRDRIRLLAGIEQEELDNDTLDILISISTEWFTEQTGLTYELGPNGTAIEGDWDDVFKCIKNCHQEVHRLGANRIYTTLKVNTRTDRKQSFREKVQSVSSANTLL